MATSKNNKAVSIMAADWCIFITWTGWPRTFKMAALFRRVVEADDF